MLEVGVGLLAGLLLLLGILIMAGPAVGRAVRLLLRRRPFGFRRRSAPASPAGVHPTTGKALAVADRLAAMLKEQGMERHVAALRHASGRLALNEADGIYAMQEVLRRLRGVRLRDGEDQEIFEGLIAHLRKTLDDRAEQLELLPRS